MCSKDIPIGTKLASVDGVTAVVDSCSGVPVDIGTGCSQAFGRPCGSCAVTGKAPVIEPDQPIKGMQNFAFANNLTLDQYAIIKAVVENNLSLAKELIQDSERNLSISQG